MKIWRNYRTARELPLCERDVDKNYFQEVRQFLDGFSLKPLEAMVIFEVFKSRRSHIGTDLISRKLGSTFFNNANIDEIVKDLAHPSRGFLRIYPSKKEVLCCNCSKQGSEIGQIIEEKCYSKLLPFYDEYNEKFSKLGHRDYTNPAGWFPPRTFQAWSSTGEMLDIKLLDIQASDDVSHEAMGKLVYNAKGVLEIKCVRCKNTFRTEMKVDNRIFWGFTFNATCSRCGQEYVISNELNGFKLKA